MRRRSRLDSEIDCTKNNDENSRILIRERNELLRWKTSVEIKTPNLFIPPQIATYIESLPFAKFAATEEADRFALLSHSSIRKLEIFGFENNTPYPESEIELPDDDFASYCLLHFSKSSQLLLATRSDGSVDVFDCNGHFYYTIPLEIYENNFDLLGAVCCLQTVVNESKMDEGNKFFDNLYVLQYNGTFSIYKIGKQSGYFKICSINLNIGMCGNFYYMTSCNLLLVSTNYKQADETPFAGLNTFRMIEGPPYVEPIRVVEMKSNWLNMISRFTSSFGNYSYLNSMAVDVNEKHLCTVSTSGDIFAFELPSTRLDYTIPYISGPKPRQVKFVDEDEVCVLLSCGSIIRSSFGNLQEAIYEKQTNEKYSPRTEVFAPTSRHLFALENQGPNIIMEEVIKKRTSFTVRLWLETFWTACVQLIRMAVGDSASPLTKASRVEILEFILSDSPTVTLQELFERTLNEKDYSRALSLATSYTTIDPDIIRKNQWKDSCKAGTLDQNMIEEVLKDINDVDFRAAACCVSFTNDRSVQEALIKMGLDIGDEAPLESQVHILHMARIFEVLDEQDLFLELKEKSLLEIAVHLAERGTLDKLKNLMESNLTLLSPYIFTILEFIPPSISPKNYEIFLPLNPNQDLQLQEKQNVFNEKLEQLLHNEDAGDYVKQFNWAFGKEINKKDKESTSIEFSTWIKKRAKIIDEETGLTNLVVELYETAQKLGFNEMDLKSELRAWKYYQKYLSDCCIITGSFEKFLKMGSEAIVQQYTKLNDDELPKCLESIIEMLEWKDPNCAIGDLLSPLILKVTSTGAKTLLKFHHLRPDLDDKNRTIAWLREYPETGSDLLSVLNELSFDQRYRDFVSQVLHYNLKPTFAAVCDAMVNRGAALGSLLKCVSSGASRCKTEADWEELRDAILYLQETVFPDLDPEDAIEIIVREYLSCEAVYRKPDSLNVFLTLTRGNTASNKTRLNFEKSIQAVLEKCEEHLQNSTGKHDQHLSHARFLATAISKVSNDAVAFLKKLEIIDIALDLGCKKMPVSIQYIDPYSLLEDIVTVEKNYKYGKKVAKLAVVLGIDTPVATALSLCALEAVKKDDYDVVQKYLSEIVNKARGIDKVYQLCIRLITSPILQEFADDIYACALLNASPELIADALQLIEKRQKDLSINQGEPEIDICSELVMDPMYSKVQIYAPNKKAELVETKLMERLTSGDEARLVAHVSSSHALGLALLVFKSSENVQLWTRNEFLLAYEESIHFHLKHLSPMIVQLASPKMLIEMRVQSDENCKALDRLTVYGCNRERFIEDSQYRKETIIGLAMTEDDTVYQDALELAKDFNIKLFDIHFASLENALTTLPPSTASKLIKERGHIQVLHEDLTEYYKQMRTTVLQQVDNNDAFRLYLSVFDEKAPERCAIPALKKLMEFSEKSHIKLNLKRAFNEATYLQQTLTNFTDAQLNQLAPLLRTLPKGSAAIDSLVRFLIEGTQLRPPANAGTLWLLLSSNAEAFLDLIAIKSRDDEIAYLKMIPLEAVPDDLRVVIEQRLHELNATDFAMEAKDFQETSNTSVLNRRRK